MSCFVSHEFQPFPRSRDLFCVACGFIKVQENYIRVPVGDNDIRIPEESNSPVIPQDPFRDEALKVISQSKAKSSFENSVIEIINNYPLPDDKAREIYQDAMNFGSALDLTHYENNIVKPLSEMYQGGHDIADDLDDQLSGE